MKTSEKVLALSILGAIGVAIMGLFGAAFHAPESYHLTLVGVLAGVLTIGIVSAAVAIFGWK